MRAMSERDRLRITRPSTPDWSIAGAHRVIRQPSWLGTVVAIRGNGRACGRPYICQGHAKIRMSASIYYRAIELAELPRGTKRAVELAGRSILVCNWAGRIFAVSNICSHAAERLECGRMSNGWIACPIHGARFDLATGAVKNPPATRPIAVFDVKIVDGWIEIGIEQVLP